MNFTSFAILVFLVKVFTVVNLPWVAVISVLVLALINERYFK